MAQLIPVDDPDDPRLGDYVRLRDVELRKHVEAEHGFFIAEGEKVVRRAIAAGFTPRSFMLAERWIPGLGAELASVPDAPCYVVSEALAERVTGFHVHRGALASLARRPLPTVDEVLHHARRVVLLEDVVDHTNVGAIMRNAAAFGIDAVLLSPRCADPLYRRSVKVAMGAVFSLPWTRLAEWYDVLADLGTRGFVTVALTPAPDAIDLAQLSRLVADRPLCLVLGSEGAGLSPRWLATAELRVRIPMSRQTDSLNVAAAAAVAFYATRSPDLTPP